MHRKRNRTGKMWYQSQNISSMFSKMKILENTKKKLYRQLNISSNDNWNINIEQEKLNQKLYSQSDFLLLPILFWKNINCWVQVRLSTTTTTGTKFFPFYCIFLLKCKNCGRKAMNAKRKSLTTFKIRILYIIFILFYATKE